MKKDFDVENRLRRYAQAFRREANPRLDLAAGLMAGVRQGTPRPQGPRTMVPSFAMAGGVLLAGILIAGIGVAPCFLVNAATTLAVIVALVFMKPAPPSSRRRGNVVGAILEGVRFLWSHPVLRWVVLLLVVTSLTVRPYNFLLPAYAVHVVHTDARGLGWLMAATGAGAIVGAFFTAATGGDRRGSIWLFSAIVGAVGVAALGLTVHFGIAAAILVVVGLATMSFIGSSNILLQTLAPDDMRGRAISVYSMILLGLVPLGALIVGALATWLELRWTFVLGGAIAVVFALWIALTQRRLQSAHARADFLCRRLGKHVLLVPQILVGMPQQQLAVFHVTRCKHELNSECRISKLETIPKHEYGRK